MSIVPFDFPPLWGGKTNLASVTQLNGKSASIGLEISTLPYCKLFPRVERRNLWEKRRTFALNLRINFYDQIEKSRKIDVLLLVSSIAITVISFVRVRVKGVLKGYSRGSEAAGHLEKRSHGAVHTETNST